MAGWSVHGEVLREQGSGVDAADRCRRVHAHDQVEFACHEEVEEFGGRRDPQAQVDVGVVGAEATELVGQMDHGGGVDHPQPERAAAPGADSVGPSGKVVGERQHLAGVCDHWCGGRPDEPSPAIAIEQCHTRPDVRVRPDPATARRH